MKVRITEFANPRMAQAFVDYMATQGVKLGIEHDNNYVLWLDDETQQTLVTQELQQFLREPENPRYLAASWQSGTINTALRYPSSSLLSTIRQRAGRLTMVVMLLCIGVFILMQLLGRDTVMAWLSWPVPDQRLELWRWFTPALLHFSLLHLLFNLMWWWYLGGMIERQLGSGKLFVIALISALLSGWLQAKFSGVMFGGLSGVVYALMGYAWLYGERNPQRGIHLEPGLMVFSIIWLVVGYVGWFGLSTANSAHVIGLVVGLAMALVDTRKR
ncbi:MAG: Rhomboid protease GlpG [Candidatus Erwinia impunctatus]